MHFKEPYAVVNDIIFKVGCLFRLIIAKQKLHSYMDKY